MFDIQLKKHNCSFIENVLKIPIKVSLGSSDFEYRAEENPKWKGFIVLIDLW
jgi:hypothetical protein